MSNADRIEELRNKYEENPRRYFAPLANEYRKAGDLAQAIAICREHLPKQPGHMSGFIVFGQTLYESGSLDEARSVFEQALALDPENLIALKHLGDIARTKGENSVARRWYERVLDADPRNDDIALQLASLSAPTPPLAIPVVPDAVVRADAPPLEDALGVFATFDPSSMLELKEEPKVAEHEQLWEPQASASPRPVHHEPIDLDFPDDPEPVASENVEENFEEGLMAPEWPDTSELVARIVTPLRSATPIMSVAVPETIAAFGLEEHDTLPPAVAEQQSTDDLVDAFIPVADVAVEHYADVITDEYAVINDDASSFDVESEFAPSDVMEFVTAAPTVGSATPVANSVEDSAPVEQPVWEAEYSAAQEKSGETDLHGTTLEEDVIALFGGPDSEAAFEVDSDNSSSEVTSQHTSEVTSEHSSEVTSEHSSEVSSQNFSGAISEDSTFEVEADNAEAVALELAHTELPAAFEEDEAAPVAAEESYAEISSELQSERLASEAQERSDSFEYEPAGDTQYVSIPEPVAQARAVGQGAPGFVTETMAELLVSQGFQARAIDIYEELVHRNPNDAVLTSRLAELRANDDAQSTPAPAANTPQFNTSVRNTPQYVTPQYATPQYVTALSTPVVSAYPYATPAASLEQAQMQRTSRDRFAELARKRVPRRTPTRATAVADDPSDGLSSLFGTTQPATPDELAARALADAFGPVQDTGESLFDLSNASVPAAPLRALTPRSVAPLQVPAAMATSDSRSAGSSNADYSFDRFFPDPAMAADSMQSATMSSATNSDSSPPANEDLAQFSAWLKGLNNA